MRAVDLKLKPGDVYSLYIEEDTHRLFLNIPGKGIYCITIVRPIQYNRLNGFKTIRVRRK